MNKMNEKQMIEKIKQFKKEKKAMIFAHYYQIPAIQDIADLVGDSLELARQVPNTDADMIVFCGVHFMAESAKILAPEKKIILPVLDAGCPMADMVTDKELKLFREDYPNVPIVCYVNSSAEVKAQSDICCTSSNAVKIVQSMEAEQLLFVPDGNLGSYIQQQVPQKDIMCWEGYCPVHHFIKSVEVDVARQKHPKAPVLVHPEINPSIIPKADFVGSTSQIIQYVNNSDSQEFIIGTEMGILHQLRKENPNKEFYLLSPKFTCIDMKKTGIEDVYRALKDEINEINVEENVRLQAFNALQKMVQIR
jgi:quinolinate synthase